MVQELAFATKYELLQQTHFVKALLPAILLKGRKAIAPTIMERNRMICIVGFWNYNWLHDVLPFQPTQAEWRERVTAAAAEEEMKQSMTRKKYSPPRGISFFYMPLPAVHIHTLLRNTLQLSTVVSLHEVPRGWYILKLNCFDSWQKSFQNIQ